MSVNFFDVNFNQPEVGAGNSIPAISGYIIDDHAYLHRLDPEGRVENEHIISKPSATTNIQGAIAMDRYVFNTVDPEDNPLSFVCCRLQPDGEYVIRSDYQMNIIHVEIWHNTNPPLDHPTDSVTLPIIQSDLGADNLSLVGHFDENDELDWVSAGYTVRDPETKETYLFMNTTGFNNTIMNLMKPYVYLKYQYPYQVVYQQGLHESDGFELSTFPDSWYNKTPYDFHTTPRPHQKFDDVVCPISSNNDHMSWASWCRVPPISTAPAWYMNENQNVVALKFGNFMQSFTLGSDMCRKTMSGGFYNGIDLDQDHLSYRGISSVDPPFDINFSGGKLRMTYHSLYRWIQLLDDEDNVVDEYKMPYPVSGGGSTIYTGSKVGANYNSLISCYLSERNNRFYLFGLVQSMILYDDDDQQIVATWNGAGFGQACAYTLLHEFNNEANTILNRATDEMVIVPADPDSLTGDNISNEDPDAGNVTDDGQQIPTPKYTDGAWDDDTTDGIRGSGRGQEIGVSSERKLDQQTDLPDIPDIPTAVSTGFMKLYNPTDQEIMDLCTELTTDSVLESLKKYFGNNPLDFIVGLHVVPGTFTKDASKYKIKYGSYQSDVAMYPITDEFTVLDYGKINLKEIYGNWEDYNPHTKMNIYLPYIGIRDIDPDKVQGTELNLKYMVDAVTGSILASLTSIRRDSDNYGAEYLVGQWGAQASYTIPLTNTQHNAAVNAVMAVVSAGVTLGAAIATSGASLPATAIAGSATGLALSGAHAGKTDITMQGSVSGALSFFTGKEAYVNITYPKEGRPNEYDHIVGMPSNLNTDLQHQPKDSYIEFLNVDVSGIDAPVDEKQMIIDLLKGGVYT